MDQQSYEEIAILRGNIVKRLLKKYVGNEQMLKVLAFVVLAAVLTVSFSTHAYADFMETLKNDFIDCWTCEIAVGLLNIMGYVSYVAMVQITDGAWKLMSVGFALWLVITTIRHMNPVVPMNPGSYIGEVSSKLFALVFIAAFFGAFSGTGTVNKMYDYTIRPLFDLSQEICLDFIYADMSGTPPQRITDIGDSVFAGNPGVNEITPVIYRPDNIFTEEDIKTAAMIFASVIIRLSESLLNALTVLSHSMSDSEDSFPSPLEMVAAIVIIIPYVWMLFVAHFTLADMYIRFAIVGALLPLLMAAYVFPYTRQKFTITGFFIITNTAVVIIMLGVFIGILTAVIDRNIDGGPLDLGLPELVDEATLKVKPDKIEAAKAAEVMSNPNSDKLWLSIFLPWLMLGAIRNLYSWGDKFGANIGSARMAMATGALFAAAVTPRKTFTNIMAPSQKREEQDPLSNQRDPEGDGRYGDERERREGL